MHLNQEAESLQPLATLLTASFTQLTAIKWMDARGELHTTTESSHPKLWRALTVSVGRLGVILEVTFKVVINKSVQRHKKVRNPCSGLTLIWTALAGFGLLVAAGFGAAETGCSHAAVSLLQLHL